MKIQRSSASSPRFIARACESIRLPIESLEGRRLLSTTLTNGVLTLTGGSGDDTFNLVPSGTNISVTENGGAAKLFATSSVKLISANLGNGANSIGISNSIAIPASVVGGNGADGIVTGGGNDTLDGGLGDDYLDGRGGDDTVSYATRTTPVSAIIMLHFTDPQTGDVRTYLDGAGGGSGEKDSFASVETVEGGTGNDTLFATAGPNAFNAPTQVFRLRVNGNGGDDFLHAEGGGSPAYHDAQEPYPEVIADGGEGNDTLTMDFTSTIGNTLIGGNGDDLFYNRGYEDRATIVPGGGYDTYELGAGQYSGYVMPPGLEKLVISDPVDSVIGNDEDDVIVVNGGGVTVDGRGGNDTITISGYSNSAIGGDGDDTITTQGSVSSIDGGAGNDSITVADSSPGPEPTTITGGDGDDLIYGGSAAEIDGGAGRDVIYAGHGDATVHGGDGEDLLVLETFAYGNIYFDGGPGADEAYVRDVDQLIPGAHYYVNAASIRRDAFSAFPALFLSSDGVRSFRLSTGEESDTISVRDLSPFYRTTVEAGGGKDVIDVSSAGTGVLNLVGGSEDTLRINADAAPGSPSVANVALTSGSSGPFPAGINLASLQIGPGGLLTLPNSSFEGNTFFTGSLAITGSGAIDLGNNAMIVDAGKLSLAAVDALVRSGYASGTWTGSGIRSSAAANAPGMTLGVALTSTTAPNYPAGLPATPFSSGVLVRYTSKGDINLDRTVNFSDLVLLAQNYNKAGKTYADGNINDSNDGKVDFADLVLLAQHYGQASSMLAALTTPTATAATKKTSVAKSVLS